MARAGLIAVLRLLFRTRANMDGQGITWIDNVEIIVLMSGSHTRRRSPLGAFTLVEVVISLLVVGIMLVAALNTVGGVFRTYAIAQERQQGDALAMELMAEILHERYEDPNGSPAFGLEAGESSALRAGYDDVDDYDGWSAYPPRSRDGTALAGAKTWTREVTVEWVDVLDPTVVVGGDSGLKRITVVATSERGTQFTRVALRGAAGMLELAPPEDRTYIAALHASLRLGLEAAAREDAIAVSNHAEDE